MNRRSFTEIQPHFKAKVPEIKAELQLHGPSEGTQEEGDTSVSSCLVAVLNLPVLRRQSLSAAKAVIPLGN